MIPKFRAWDNDNNQWYKPTYRAFEDNLEYLEIGLNGRLSIVTKTDGQIKVLDESCFDGRFELMQSTGLCDRNGIEIYEGDILNHPLQGMRKVYYPFNDRVASYGLENIENGMRNTLQDTHKLYEVIGNVHEHSHLLDNGGQQQ